MTNFYEIRLAVEANNFSKVKRLFLEHQKQQNKLGQFRLTSTGEMSVSNLIEIAASLDSDKIVDFLVSRFKKLPWDYLFLSAVSMDSRHLIDICLEKNPGLIHHQREYAIVNSFRSKNFDLCVYLVERGADWRIINDLYSFETKEDLIVYLRKLDIVNNI